MRAAALVVALTVAAACSQDPGGAGDDRVVLQVAGEAEEVAVYEALIAAFSKEHPDIRVDLVPVADKDDHLARLATSFSGGDPPDVFLVNYREYAQFVPRGALEPIEGHLDRAGIDVSDYFEQPIEAFMYDGALQCMPQNVSSLVVYYNVDLFDAAGIGHPRSWTWEEFRRVAIELTDGATKGVGIDPEIIRLAPFAWSNGGEIVDDDTAPTRFTLDDPATREALEYLVRLVRVDRVVPGAAEVEAEDLETRFMTGKIAMLLSSRRETPAFREVLGLNFDVAPLPVASRPAGILHSDAYCIARGSDRIDEAVSFVGFAIGRQGQTITALGGRTVPSLMEVASSPAFLDPTQSPRHSEVFLETIPYLRRTPVIPTWPEIEDLAGEVLTRVFYEDGYSIDRGIQEIDDRTRSLFEESGA